MKIRSGYKARPVRFLEILEQDGWKIKLYSISARSETVNPLAIETAKYYLSGWLKMASLYHLDTYSIATLILHEGKEGCFVIINWWIDEHMLQQFVYLAAHDDPATFILYSDKGIITCVWEMAVLWFERNAWVKHVLMKPARPDFEAYINEHLNADV